MTGARDHLDHPVLDVIADRWSPRALDPRPVEADALASLFEAARWAASCFNDQPWAWVIVGREDPEFPAALACLAEKNREWAQDAGVLAFACARRDFERNGKPNRWAAHDVGQANAHLALQARSMGLAVHQMGGFSAERVGETFGVPEGWDPLTSIAIAYPAADAEPGPRSRKPQSAFTFRRSWGRPKTA